MRKRYRVLLLAALGAAFIAPVGFASFESAPPIVQTVHSVHSAAATSAASAVTAPVVWHLRDAASASVPPQGFDAAGLLMVGTVLFGLAAVIRKYKAV